MVRDHNPRQIASHVVLKCFFCDREQRRRIDELTFGHLKDYSCPGCRRTATTHVVKVLCEGVDSGDS